MPPIDKLCSVDSIRRAMIFVSVYGPPFVIFIAPALINGFPLVYSDSGTYLLAAIQGYVPADRPVYYSLFLFPLHWRSTLWPPIVAQSAITVAVLDIFLRRSLVILTRPQLALLLCAVAGLTSLPVYASEIMPDIFTPLMILSLCILIFRSSDVTSGERLFLYAVVILAVCVHQANFVIAFLTLVSAVPFRLLMDRSSHQLIRSFAASGALLLLGVGLLILPNYIARREFVTTPGAGTFLLAKLLEDGPALDYLTAECRIRNYSICSQLLAVHHYKETRSAQMPSIADYFLWSGPLEAAGGWFGLAPYASSIAVASILHDPGGFVLASLEGFAHQLVLFDTGDGLGVYGPKSPISTVLRLLFSSGVNRAYLTSRQETGRLDWTIISHLHKVSVVVGLLVIVILLAGAFRTTSALGGTLCTLLLAVVANAAVMGTLSPVHARYQSRVVGLIVIVAMMLVYRQVIQKRLLRFAADTRNV
jgi:hypothetical protein